MTIDDAALVRLDALLLDFVSNNRALFGFTEEPTAAAMSAAGRRFFRKGYLVLRDEAADASSRTRRWTCTAEQRTRPRGFYEEQDR
jgi:hypothetical protein